MRLYLNDDTTGILIDSYNHNYTLINEHFLERYNITVNGTESINPIVSNYENVVITHFIVKNDNNITIKEVTNIALKIAQIDETINSDSQFIMLNLST